MENDSSHGKKVFSNVSILQLKSYQISKYKNLIKVTAKHYSVVLKTFFKNAFVGKYW